MFPSHFITSSLPSLPSRSQSTKAASIVPGSAPPDPSCHATTTQEERHDHQSQIRIIHIMSFRDTAPTRRGPGRPPGSKNKSGPATRSSKRQRRECPPIISVDDDSHSEQDPDADSTAIPLATQPASRTQGLPPTRRSKSEIIDSILQSWWSEGAARVAVPTDYTWLKESAPDLASKEAAITALRNRLRAGSNGAELWQQYKDLGQMDGRSAAGHLSLWKLCLRSQCLPSDLIGYKYKTRPDMGSDGNLC